MNVPWASSRPSPSDEENRTPFPAGHRLKRALTLSAGTSQTDEAALADVEKDVTNSVLKDGSDSSVAEWHDGVTKRGKFKKLFRKGHVNVDDETLVDQTSEDLSVKERKRKAFKRKIPIGQTSCCYSFLPVTLYATLIPIRLQCCVSTLLLSFPPLICCRKLLMNWHFGPGTMLGRC